MDSILDAAIHGEFWEDTATARQKAVLEAVNTGSAVVTVDAIDVEAGYVTLIGTVPECVFASASPRLLGRPGVRSFHTTWGAILKPDGPLGFAVVRQPLNSRPAASTTAEHCRVALRVQRRFRTLPQGTLGLICCSTCRIPIPADRLQALPGTRICHDCQEKKEGGKTK